MSTPIAGLHHVTALAKSPQENKRFYTTVLAQRMVKRTVNFDDPGTYHLYYGDDLGSPGTLLTHFPHPYARRGVHGNHEIERTILAIPQGSLGFWRERLDRYDVAVEASEAFGQSRLHFADHDGMLFALAEQDESGAAPVPVSGDRGGLPEDRALGRILGVAIRVAKAEATASALTEVLGFRPGAVEGSSQRFAVGEGSKQAWVELIEDPEAAEGDMGAGTVHHVAWRVATDADQAWVADRLREARIGVTEVRDRFYFRSIYFRMPGGVIFEVATDGPGMDADEPRATLGEALQIPPMYKSQGAQIAAHLEPLE